MPIYEYRCAKCGKVFEVLQKFSDAPLKKHEKCGGKVERLISASGFQLKGGGWYATDYARAGSKGGGESSGESSKEGESKESKSGDSKSSDSKSSESTSAKSETKSEAKSDTKAKPKKD